MDRVKKCVLVSFACLLAVSLAVFGGHTGSAEAKNREEMAEENGNAANFAVMEAQAARKNPEDASMEIPEAEAAPAADSAILAVEAFPNWGGFSGCCTDPIPAEAEECPPATYAPLCCGQSDEAVERWCGESSVHSAPRQGRAWRGCGHCADW